MVCRTGNPFIYVAHTSNRGQLHWFPYIVHRHIRVCALGIEIHKSLQVKCWLMKVVGLGGERRMMECCAPKCGGVGGHEKMRIEFKTRDNYLV